MDSLASTQDQLKKGSQRINQMLQEIENKQVHMLSRPELLYFYCASFGTISVGSDDGRVSRVLQSIAMKLVALE